MRLFKQFEIPLLVFFISVFVVSNSIAGFDYTPKKKEKEPEYNEEAYVLQHGQAFIEKKSSFGSDMPIKNALTLITPDGWGVEYKDKGIKDDKVTWEIKDEIWTQALNNISKDGYGFLVDWNNNKVHVAQASNVDTLKDIKQSKKEKKIVSKRLEVANNYEKEQEKDKVDINIDFRKIEYDKEEVWAIERGNLKPQIEKWCDKADYQLVWESDYDYEIPVEAEFKGEFIEAVSNVIDSLYRGGAKISAKLYKGNNVLVIHGE